MATVSSAGARKSLDPISTSAMSTSPLAQDDSSSSRPASPANEADEEDVDNTPTTTTPVNPVGEKVATSTKGTDDRDEGTKEGRRRTSSVWKGLNLKRRMSKVNLKISNTLNDVGRRSSTIFYHGPTDGTPLSPVEISPVSDEGSRSAATLEITNNQGDVDLAAIESSIVQSLSDIEASGSNKSPNSLTDPADSHTANSSDQESSATEPMPVPPPRVGRSHGAIPKQRTQPALGRPMSQPHDAKRSESESTGEQVATVKSVGLRLEGAHISRPTELSLFDDGCSQPQSMDRAKRNRMQSVPNIKLSRQETNKLKSASGKDSSLVDMLRRFSKYLLNDGDSLQSG